MNRRPLLLAAALACVGGAAALAAPAAAQAEEGGGDPAYLETRLQACTPGDALSRLQQGNDRFVQAWAAARAADDPGQRQQQAHHGAAAVAGVSAAPIDDPKARRHCGQGESQDHGLEERKPGQNQGLAPGGRTQETEQDPRH